MAQVTFRIPDRLLEQIDTYIEDSQYSNRSDFFRSVSRREMREVLDDD